MSETSAPVDGIVQVESYVTLGLSVILLVFNVIANVRNRKDSKFTFVNQITLAFILCDISMIVLEYTNVQILLLTNEKEANQNPNYSTVLYINAVA